jgi:5'-3' exonuclease
MSRVLLAVDVSNQVYKASAAHATLTSDGRFTGGLYGFIFAIQKAIMVCKATHVVLCTDTKPYLRSKLYPEYKSLRKDSQDPDLVERYRESLPMIKHFAESIGWPMWSLPGFESDDLVAHCVTQHRHRYDRIIAMSNDSDLYQLFKYPQFAVYKGTKGLYEREDYYKEFNLDPAHIPRLLALTGTHNEVEGLRGVGPVNARRIVLDPKEYRNVRVKYADIIDRNIELITLPHKDFPKTEGIPKAAKLFSERAFVRFCGQYDINITQAACQAFERIRI